MQTHAHTLALWEPTGSFQVQHGLGGPVPSLEGSLQRRNVDKKTTKELVCGSASDLSDKYRRSLTFGALQDCETNDARSASVSAYVRVTALSRCVKIMNKE